MSKKHAFVKYTKKGKLIPGSLVITSAYPKETANGVWEEVPINLFCCEPITTTTVPPAFRMLFSDINEVNAIIGDSLNVNDWNTYFDLPNYGSLFTSVEVIGNEVRLFGGSDIILKEELFDQSDSFGTYLLQVDDQIGCVIEIQYDAFGYDNNDGCMNLVSANFPNAATIGEYAFYDCESLTSLNIPSAVTLEYGAISGCLLLTSIDLPLVTTIENYCFIGCQSLTLINIPNCISLGSTTSQNDSVFSNITGNSITLTVSPTLLTCNAGNPDEDILSLIILNNVLVNGNIYYPFEGYSGDLTISFNNISNANLLVGDATNLNDWNNFIVRNYGIPFTAINVVSNTVTLTGGGNVYLANQFTNNSNITEISDTGCVAGIIYRGFENCDSLINVDFLEVTSLGYSTFSYCISLLTANFSKLTTLGGGNCFYNCSSLQSIDFPLLTTITGEYCFFNCHDLATVNLPQLTTSAGATFSQCFSITSISFPNLVTITGQSCFGNCGSLTSVNLPVLETTGDACFAGCSALSTVTLPQAVTVGFSCFAFCNSLSTVNLPLATTILTQCFLFGNSLSSINIPSCTNFGGTVGNDSVFQGVSGRPITLTIPSALMTCNSGNPDGDITDLQSRNTVTIVTV